MRWTRFDTLSRSSVAAMGALTALPVVALLVALSAAADETGDEDTVVVPSAAPAAEIAPEPDPEPALSGGIEEIVVTARKREETLQDVPVSVSALSGQALIDAGINYSQELRTVVPNLQIQTSAEGTSAFIFIRGVGPSAANQSEPGVGVYVDGVYLARNEAALLDMVDVAQIQVLRGPQGTLFGKNSVGGALLVTTNKPGPDPEIHTLIRGGSYTLIDSRATINLPINFGPFEDQLFTRWTFASGDTSGYATNLFNLQDYNDDQMRGGTGALRWLPHDDVTLDLTGFYQQRSNNGRGYQCTVQDGADGEPIGVSDTARLFVPQRRFLNACADQTPFQFKADTPPYFRNWSYGLFGTAEWEVGELWKLDNLDLKWITAWREQQQRTRRDIDNTAILGSTGARITETNSVGQRIILDPFVGEPLPGMDGGEASYTQVSSELQINFSAWDGRINGVTGFYGLYDTADENTANAFVLLQPVIGIPASVSATAVNESTRRNWTAAWYAQATTELYEWFNLTLGIRRIEEERNAKLFAFNSYLARDNDPGAVFADAPGSKRFGAWTPMASIAFPIPDDLLGDSQVDSVMPYFTFARGYKSGGFNVNELGDLNEGQQTTLSEFLPEKLYSYEVGAKTSFFGRRLILNGAFYYSDYRDLQVVVLEVGEFGESKVRTDNAPKSRIIGGEVEVSALLVEEAGILENLRFGGGVGIADTEYLDYPGTTNRITGQPVNRRGESFNAVPKVQANGSLSAEFPISGLLPDWLAGRLRPRIGFYYQDEVHYDFVEVTNAVQPSYWLCDVRLGYEFLDGRAEIAFWGKNVTDEEYFNFANNLTNPLGTVTRFYAPPQTFGGEFIFTWDEF